MTSTAETPAADKLDFKVILPVFVIVLVDLLGLSIIIPLLPLYAASFGATPLMIGVIGAAYPLSQLIGGPLLGRLSDRYGRKPVLIVSQFGTLIGFILLALAGGLPMILLSRVIDGLSGANIVAAQAAITDSTTERNRTQGLGLIGAAFGLGFTLGPAIAGISLAISGNDFRIPALIAAGCSLLSIVLTSVWFKETLTSERMAENRQKRASEDGGMRRLTSNYRRAFAMPVVATLLIVMFMQQLIFGGYENLFALFSLSRLGMSAAGNALLFVFVGVILVVVQGGLIGPWSRRFGERRLILVGLVLLAAGLVLTALTPHQTVPWYSYNAMLADMTGSASAASSGTTTIQVPLPSGDNSGWLGLVWLLIATVPIAVGAGVLSPSINGLITRRIERVDTGSVLGVSTSLVSLANVITPIVGGILFQFAGTTAPFLLGGLALFAVAALAQRRLAPGIDGHTAVPAAAAT